MPPRVRTAAFVLRLSAWLGLATAAAVLFVFVAGAFLIGLGGERHEIFGSPLLGGGGLILFGTAAAFGAAGLFAARGIADRRPWARASGRVLGVLLLPVIPAGTALGAIVLGGLRRGEADAWFAGEA